MYFEPPVLQIMGGVMVRYGIPIFNDVRSPLEYIQCDQIVLQDYFRDRARNIESHNCRRRQQRLTRP